MEAKVNTPDQPVGQAGKSLLEKIADKLMKAQQELDELAIQLALGKVEAKEKFEEVKKEFRAHVQEVKNKLTSKLLKEMVTATTQKLEELEVQLALGKADSAEIFEAQTKKILRAIQSLEKEIKDKFLQTDELNSFGYEMEKFKLKIEILRLKFILKRFEVKDEFKDRMQQAHKRIDQFKESAMLKLNEGKDKAEDFKDEVQVIYKHFRKALESL